MEKRQKMKIAKKAKKSKNKTQQKKSKTKTRKGQEKSKTMYCMILSRGGRFLSLSRGFPCLACNGAPPAPPTDPSGHQAESVGRAAALVVASPVGRGTRLRGPVRK